MIGAALAFARGNLRDPRALLLIAAFALALLAILLPPIPITRNGVRAIVVVDITGSMNTRDYTVAGRPESRLAVAKAALKEMVGNLPCPSSIGLGLFSERVSFLLFEPIDVCRDYGALAGAIEAIDWREAWDGDSYIATGLLGAIDVAKSLGSDLVFVTDGQEAPPLPWSGAPPFEGKKGEVKGLIVGAGGYALSPIPKFDERGNEVGFWGVDDVPHENHSGPPPPDAESRPGYQARNAPFGSEAPKGTEHLSSVREPYLKTLASETGLAYAHLTPDADLADALRAAATKRPSPGFVDLRWIPGGLALGALLVLYGVVPFLDRRARSRARPATVERFNDASDGHLARSLPPRRFGLGRSARPDAAKGG
jgi:mxaL protein